MRAKQFIKRSLQEAANNNEAGIIVAEVVKLIGEGHTEVSPDVITTKVSAALGRPFMLKDLVAVNNSSEELQHYIDSINPSKIKFSTDILTVKNQDPMKEKEQAQATVANMASRAANRPRLGEAADQGASKAKETEFHKELDSLVHRTFGKRKGEVEESAEELNVGDDVIITGPVEHKGETGVIDSFGQDNRFVVVNLYNHGKKSFHSSDVSYNDYADSDAEEAEMYDRDPEFRDWAARQDVAEGKLWRVAYSVEDERYGTPYDDKVFDNPGEAQGHVYNIKRAAELAGQEVPVIGYQWFYPEEVDEDKVGSWVVHKDGKFLGRFATRKGAKAHAEKHGATVASSEYYNDHVKKVEEGWGAETAEKRHREQMTATAKVLQKYKNDPVKSKIANYLFVNNWAAPAIEKELADPNVQQKFQTNIDKYERQVGPVKDWSDSMAADYLQGEQGLEEMRRLAGL